MTKIKTMVVSLACALAGASASAAAQTPKATPTDYPNRSTRFIVPYTPGAINDFVARLVAQKLTDAWGQQVVVDNRPGAGTLIGTELVARANPDGYTLLLVPTAFAVNVTLYPKLPYDPIRDFTPVTQIGSAPFLFVCGSQVPVKNVKELVALAKAKPGQLSYGSTGSGGSAHLMGEMFKSQAGIEMSHIPYKGLAPALTDVMAGQVSCTFGSQLAVEGQVKAGRLRALAVTSKTRSKAAPDVPSIAEQGYPEFNGTGWWGVVVPAGTPKPIVTRLNADIVRLLSAPDVRERLLGQGVEIAATSPEQFAQFIREEIKRWSVAVKQSGAKPE
ncbi:MAG: tripartite tricarboxylate transporter substrate binding protein [Burkholderiales bacterium]